MQTTRTEGDGNALVVFQEERLMEFQKSIEIKEWDKETKRKVIDFWQERGVMFTETEGDILRGWRGSLWDNLTSFDMSRLLATVTVSKTSPTEIRCVLSVNTIMQIISQWNRAYWQLEMNTLESWLLSGDKKEVQWQEFLRSTYKAAFGIVKPRLTPEVEALLSDQNGENTLLRGSQMPITSDLLRPASASESAASEELLRCSDSPE